MIKYKHEAQASELSLENQFTRSRIVLVFYDRASGMMVRSLLLFAIVASLNCTLIGCSQAEPEKTKLQSEIESLITEIKFSKINFTDGEKSEENPDRLAGVKRLAALLDTVTEEDYQDATDSLSTAGHNVFLPFFTRPDFSKKVRELSVTAITKRASKTTTGHVVNTGEIRYHVTRRELKVRLLLRKDDSELEEIEQMNKWLDHVKYCLELLKGERIKESKFP